MDDKQGPATHVDVFGTDCLAEMFDQWWQETPLRLDTTKGCAYRIWCAALGYDCHDSNFIERQSPSPNTADPELVAFERWCKERPLIDYETPKRLLYRAWLASAAEPPRVAFPTEFPLGSEVPSGVPLQPEPIDTAKSDFDRWWAESCHNPPNVELVDRVAYRAWCAALGFDVEGDNLVKRVVTHDRKIPSTFIGNPAAPRASEALAAMCEPNAADFDLWWQNESWPDERESRKRLAYRAWCAGAATGTVTPKLDSLEMLYRIARKEGWCAEAPASGLPVQPESVRERMSLPPLETTRRFDEWWEEFREGEVRPNFTSRYFSWHAWCAGREGTPTPNIDRLDQWWSKASGGLSDYIQRGKVYALCRMAYLSSFGEIEHADDTAQPACKTATSGTRRFDEWWDAFRKKDGLSEDSKWLAWEGWCAAHRKLGASMAGDNLSLNPAWLCQCGTAYEGARPKARTDLAPDRLAEGGIRVWACQCGAVYEGHKPPVCDPARTRFEAYSRGLGT